MGHEVFIARVGEDAGSVLDEDLRYAGALLYDSPILVGLRHRRDPLQMPVETARQ